MVLGQIERAPALVPDQPDHRETAGVDVGTDPWPLDLPRTSDRPLRTDRAHPPELERAAQPIQREDLAADERPEEGRAVLRWLRIGRNGQPGFEALADVPDHPAAQPGGRIAHPHPAWVDRPESQRGPGREAVREMQPVGAWQEARNGVRFDHRREAYSWTSHHGRL